MSGQKFIRNYCVIAHIDHGKSTLSDRLLEFTGTISARDMTAQFLDSMDLEREKGITIKAKAVRMEYKAADGQTYELNLIDTPGHVDFTYEVSRALAACEGAVLVVDASQGIEAQTLANLYLAFDQDLEIIPVVNKIDLPAAEGERVAEELRNLLGVPREEIIMASAKEGIGTEKVLETVVKVVPPPTGDSNAPLRALVFDSHYDPYKGVIAYIRVVDGKLTADVPLQLMNEEQRVEALEIGIFTPKMKPLNELSAGQVGYVATGLKDVSECPVGDTLTTVEAAAAKPLAGYRPAKPMVFAGVYPVDGNEYSDLRDALDKLRLNDAALVYEPETSQALNFGFRCGFLGLLHMEIMRERMAREYGLDLLFTAPSVEYQILRSDGEIVIIDNPAQLPPENDIEEILEPWMKVTIYTPATYIGPVMELAKRRRGDFIRNDYIDQQRMLLEFYIPLSELAVDFYDQLKSRTRGYASMDYEFAEYRAENLVKMDILINGEPVDALSTIVHRDMAYEKGSALTQKLKEVIPRQMFAVAIQAAIGSRVIARTNVRALRKDVTAKLYGGDITRKKKVLEKQKEGKKKMKRLGSVELPSEAFTAVLSLED